MARTPVRRDPSPKPALATRPLLVTADERLLDDLLRLAAAAGVDVEVAHDPGTARSRWSSVPMVVVGDDQAEGLAALAPTRRQGVFVVGNELDDADAWRRGVALGAEHVLFFPADEVWLADRFADAAEGESAEALVLGVLGGRGGAGASVFATATAIAAARRGLGVVLVDLDPLGGGLDLVLGAEDVPGLRWPDLAGSRGRLSARALRSELPVRHGVALVSSARHDVLDLAPDAIEAVISASRRAGQVVVLDLPRRVEAIEGALAACSSVALVVPADVRAVAAAGQLAVSATTLCSDLRVVARGTPAGVDGGDVASALSLPVAVEMAPEPGIDAALERGDPPGLDAKGPLARGAAALLDSLLFPSQVLVA